jgi:hypothetical protein
VCGPRLRDAERLEAFLSAPAPAAPAGFEERVLARIAAEAPLRAEAGPARPAVAEPRRLPWWSFLGADPVLPLALAAASVLLGLIRVVFALAGLPLHLSLPSPGLEALRAVLDGSPLRAAAVALALLPPLLLFSRFLYRSTQGVVRTSLLRR